MSLFVSCVVVVVDVDILNGMGLELPPALLSCRAVQRLRVVRRFRVLRRFCGNNHKVSVETDWPRSFRSSVFC